MPGRLVRQPAEWLTSSQRLRESPHAHESVAALWSSAHAALMAGDSARGKSRMVIGFIQVGVGRRPGRGGDVRGRGALVAVVEVSWDVVNCLAVEAEGFLASQESWSGRGRGRRRRCRRRCGLGGLTDRGGQRSCRDGPVPGHSLGRRWGTAARGGRCRGRRPQCPHRTAAGARSGCPGRRAPGRVLGRRERQWCG